MGQILILGCLSLLVSGKLHVRPFGPSPPKTYLHNIPTDRSVKSRGSSPKAIVHSFMRSRGFSMEDYVIRNHYTSKHTGVKHFYLRQLVSGLEVFNGDININLSPSGEILSYGDSFYREKSRPFSPVGGRQVAFEANRLKEAIGPLEALGSLLDLLALNQTGAVEQVSSASIEGEPFVYLKNVTSAYQDPRAIPGWIQLDDETLEAVWNVQLDVKDDWFNAHVSATSRAVLSLVNWVSNAEYTVFPIGINDPGEGTQVKVYDPANKVASPLGWHDRGHGKSFTDTEGNNVIAGHLDEYYIPKHPGVDGGKKLEFDFPLNLKKDPAEYMSAAITNLFYWSNTLHDLYYQYGFDEVAGNFQENNFGRGGKGNDAVAASAQDADGYDNADFASPPDGQRPRMNMYVWDMTSPMRDGDLESDIIIHEYSHGLSTRLTGGPANSDCLDWGESGGMGEGWGDIIAILLRLNATHDRNTSFTIGNYAVGGQGIRRYPYSTHLDINPETYATLNQPENHKVHAEGATWANMLFEVYWNLAESLPFTQQWFPKSHSEIPKFSNTLMLQLLIDGMKLQPCRPTFTDARDAILHAESILTQAKYKCHLWKAFAKRGLGTKAKLVGNSPWGGGTRTESFAIPKECRSI